MNKATWITVAGLAQFAVATAACAADENLLPNSSFQAKTPGGVSGWQSRAWQGEEDCRWNVEDAGRANKSSLSIRSANGSDAAWTTTVNVKPNGFYRLSGWIKTADMRGATGALLNIQEMPQVRMQNVARTHNWTHVSTLLRVSEETELEITGDGQIWAGRARICGRGFVPQALHLRRLQPRFGRRSQSPYGRRWFGTRATLNKEHMQTQQVLSSPFVQVLGGD